MASNRRFPKLGFFRDAAPKNASVVVRRFNQYELLPYFLEAVIDDNQNRAAELLEVAPELVTLKPRKPYSIQSWHTGERIPAENALTMALKRKQVDMVCFLLPYFYLLEEQGIIFAANTAALEHCETPSADPLATPAEYRRCIESLFDAFITETFPHGINDQAQLSAETEIKLRKFHALMRPAETVALNERIEVEHMLYVTFQIYFKRYKEFQNDNQCTAFCVRVIGYLQSIVTPETAKIFCEGIYFVVEQNQKIHNSAQRLVVSCARHHDYYSEQFGNGRVGIGKKYMMGWFGVPVPIPLIDIPLERQAYSFGMVFEEFYTKKVERIASIMQELQRQPRLLIEEEKQSSCNICYK